MVNTKHAHILVPVANLDNARRTCDNLSQYPDTEIEKITVIHVIEQTKGYMDTTSPSVLEQEAAKIFSYFEDHFGSSIEVQRELRYSTDVIKEIITAADDLNVSAIGFSPQPKSRLQRLLTRDSSYRLITESHHPVVIFSEKEAEDE